ncbi:MauE/DoxX family redox-associated membrane protein [Streptomyces sp. NK08204]|uniref:MauE/DoxX family redox-associated membrane protein n=1 Tax=Streptomyces sp. NK08204 TaxID=2873260 RepID=UPI001CEC3AAA|nr:MauE/DoxX family redox-associated membrane protein [Streptomyces sp. NK08204]
MATLATSLVPLLLGVLLAVTGAGKAFGRQVARQAAGTVLVRVLNDGRRATLVLRATGAVELAVAVGLLAAPATVGPGVAATVLGTGFLGYLGYARATAPESSCGCTARDNGPVSWRAFARAGLVVAGGAAAVGARTAWWTEAVRHPVASVAVLAVALAVLVAVSSDLDHLWLVPLRRTRLKVFGHPLLGNHGEEVPVAASVELLERSLAWVAASPVVRSGLIDHWEADGWRFLQFAGVHDPDGTARPVTVLFALDPHATRDTTGNPAVRVTLIDDRTDEPVEVDLLAGFPARTTLPTA